MFDLIPNEIKTVGAGAEYMHNDPSDISLFTQRGSVRRVPIEALATRTEYTTRVPIGSNEEVTTPIEVVEPQPMPDYSALQNTATGDILNTRPITKSYKLVPHDELFSNHASILLGGDLPQSNIDVHDRIYDGGLRAHRTVYFNDLTAPIGDGSDVVRCRMDIFNSIDMSWAFQIFSGAYRDLCRNTLVFGGQKSYHQRQKHTKNLEPTALINKAAMGLEMWTGQVDQMNIWRGAKLSDEQFGDILQQTVCFKGGAAAEQGKVKPVNERLFNYLMHQFNAEKAELGQTMWAAYNALTHWSTHTNETWEDEKGTTRQTGKNTASQHMVQRKRNDNVRDVITSPSWQYLESLAA